MTKKNPSTAWGGAPLNQMLSDDNPIMLVHKSHQHSTKLPELLSQLGNTHGQQVGFGSIIRLPKMQPKAASRYMDGIQHVPLRIVDPELWRFKESGGWGGAETPDPKKKDHWKYLKPTPRTVNKSRVKEILKIQREYGATVLLSATGWVSEANGDVNLSKAMEWVDESRQQSDECPMWVNLTLDQKWLTNSSLRDTLLNEMLESNEDDWYLRFWWTEITPRGGQLQDLHLLRGYKELVTVAASEGKRVYLPNSGIAGWLLTGLGAAGYSTGMSSTEQSFAQQPIIRRAKGRPSSPPIPRIIDPSLLHIIEYQEFLRISTIKSHQNYTSPYLSQITPNQYQAELAKLHYLWTMGQITADISKKNPAAMALNKIRTGQNFVNSLNSATALLGANNPTHLATWSKLIR